MEWIKITLSGGRMFSCPLNKWLDSGEDAGEGKPSWAIECHKSGRNVINKNRANQSIVNADGSLEECSNEETSITPTASPSTFPGAYCGEIYNQKL